MTVQFSVVPTVDTSVYASGDHLGSLMTFTGVSEESMLKAVTIIDYSNQKSALDLLLFGELPTIASADNDAFSIAEAELKKANCNIPVVAGDYSTVGAGAVATIKNLNIPIQATPTATGNRNIYGQMVSKGTPTYTGASKVKVILHIEPIA